MIDHKEFKSILDLVHRFPTEQSCIDHLERVYWDGVPVSPFDPASKVYKCAGGKYKCKNSNKYFNVRTGTIFEDTKMPLQKWFIALYIFSSHKKGISSHQLARDLDITQKSGWFVLHRLRHAFAHLGLRRPLDGEVEMDEVLIGGLEGNKHEHKKLSVITKSHTSPSDGKATVFGMLQRADVYKFERPHKIIKGAIVKDQKVYSPSRVMAGVVPNRLMKTLKPIIFSNVKCTAMVLTDEHNAYTSLRDTYLHGTVNHSANEFVKGHIHTNGIECFWSHMKRGIDGIYHSVSAKHLQSYVDEYALRFNTREQSTNARFDFVLSNIAGRLKYHKLISK